MKKGCLIIHGLTGTPATVSFLRQAFLEAGFIISVPCLAGHGSTPDELSRTSWQDWYETIRISYGALRKETDRVFCAGISLGALLAMKLAVDEGWGIRAMALMATPLELPFYQRCAAHVVKYSPLRFVIKNVSKDYEKSVADENGRLLYEQMSFSKIPVNAVFEIQKLQREVLGNLEKISNPTLLLHGRHDKVVKPSNIDLFAAKASSSVIEVKIFDNSRHVLTMDSEKKEVAETIVEFFGKFS